MTFVHFVDKRRRVSSGRRRTSSPRDVYDCDNGRYTRDDIQYNRCLSLSNHVVDPEQGDTATVGVGDDAISTSLCSTRRSKLVDSVKSLAKRRMPDSTQFTHGSIQLLQPIQPADSITDPLVTHLLRHFANNLACWVSLAVPALCP